MTTYYSRLLVVLLGLLFSSLGVAAVKGIASTTSCAGTQTITSKCKASKDATDNYNGLFFFDCRVTRGSQQVNYQGITSTISVPATEAWSWSFPKVHPIFYYESSYSTRAFVTFVHNPSGAQASHAHTDGVWSGCDPSTGCN